MANDQSKFVIIHNSLTKAIRQEAADSSWEGRTPDYGAWNLAKIMSEDETFSVKRNKDIR